MGFKTIAIFVYTQYSPVKIFAGHFKLTNLLVNFDYYQLQPY